MLLNFIKLAGWQLSGVAIGWMKIFLGGNFLGGKFPGVNFPGGSFPGWELSRWDLSWVGIFFGGSFPGGNCVVGIIRVAIFWVGVFMLFLWSTTGTSDGRENFWKWMIGGGEMQFGIKVGGRGWWRFAAGLQYSSGLYFFFFYGLPDIIPHIKTNRGLTEINHAD